MNEFKKLALSTFDKEAADLREDFGRWIDKGQLEADEAFVMRILIFPRVIREQMK